MKYIPFLVVAAFPVAAQPQLVLPLDCDLDETCYIQQFTDRDPSPAAADFTCGPLAYDGHKGTDFAVPTVADQAAGVTVLAAADGVVLGMRDDMLDILQIGPDAPDVAGRECGNGLVLDHGDGWETQYCHMARGSIVVAQGDTVTAGQPLGLMGLSGESQFPHLHLSVRHDGAVIDPFDPDGATACNVTPATTLWADPPPYRPGGILTTGFDTGIPDFAAMKVGLPAPALRSDVPLVLWAHLFGGRVDDILRLTIIGPDGSEVFTIDDRLEATQAQLMRAGGRRAPAGGWPPGSYAGAISLIRDGTVIDESATTARIP